MPCGPYQLLEITDGTTTVDLLSRKSGFCHVEWSPAISEPKAGGVWKDSQLADGRKMAMRKRANVIESYTLAVRNWTPDDLIRDTQNLRRLLEKAAAYSTSKWQDEPVWIKRQGIYEGNAGHTIVQDYRTPQDNDPHDPAYFWNMLGRAAFPTFILTIEREPWWTADQPGTGTCVQASGEQEDWVYDAWAINTAQPAALVNDIIEAGCGNMLACESTPEVWRTATGGAVWTAAAVPPILPPYVMLDSSDGNIYCAGFFGANWEVERSADCGVNWVQRSNVQGTDSYNSLDELGAFLYLCPGSVAAPNGGTIVRSNDGGATWAVCYTFPRSTRSYAITAVSDGFLYATGTGAAGQAAYIVRSNNGTAWAVVWSMLSATAGSHAPELIKELADDYIYMAIKLPGTDPMLLLRSGNGTDWGIVWSLATASTPGDIILASDGYYYFSLVNGEIYRSLDTFSWQLVTDIGGGNTLPMIEYSGNDRIYAGENGDVWISPVASTSVGRAATCTDEVFVANKGNVAQLTDIYTYTAGPTWTAQFPHVGAFPYQLFPAVMANGDAVYFGIDQAVTDSGPFDNLVLDITTAAFGVYTATWQYSDGVAGWPALNVQDGTTGFGTPGVNSVHWVPPDAAAPGGAWATEAVGVPAVTALWVRAIIGGVAGAPVGAQQGNRDVYTVNWPRVDVDEAQVLGDISALAQMRLRNRSDEDGYVSTIDELDTLENRVIVGLRSMSRGAAFTAYLNCADEQNPMGVTAAVGANTAFATDIQAPSGRIMVHTTTGLSTWTDECTFTLASSIARDFYGSFHAYHRAQEVDWDTEIGEVLVRLQVRTGSGGVTFTTDHKPFRNLNDWQLLDFDSLDVPASDVLSSGDLPDEAQIVVQIWSSISSLTVNLYDLILIPTDEWAGDFVDKALEDDSGVTNGYLLDVDSVTYPKRDLRAMVRTSDATGFVRSIYQPNTPGPAILQSNADQRLWFLTARGMVTGTHTGINNQTTLTDAAASFITSGVQTSQVIFNVTDGSAGTVGATVTGTTITDCGLAGGTDNDWDTNDVYVIICPNWRSEPWNDHSIQVWANARYLSSRGGR